jgi:hypothetical protein
MRLSQLTSLQSGAGENLLGKLALVRFEAMTKMMPVQEIVEQRFPNSEAIATIVKSAQDPAMTTVPAYAGALAKVVYGELVELLRDAAILPAVIPAANNYQFEGASLLLPVRLGTQLDAAGGFRAEGGPITVKGLTFGSKTLTPKSLAVILTATGEMLRRSTVDLAAYFRNAMARDTARMLDQHFVGNSAPSAIAPAGARYGLAAGDTRASTGATAAQITADIKAMLSALTTAGMGDPATTKWLVHPKNAAALATLFTVSGSRQFPETESGRLAGYPVVVSTAVPADIVLLVDFSHYAFAMGSPEFLPTLVATVHEENTTPLPISAPGSPNTVAAPTRSFFQTESWALRMVMEADWLKLTDVGPVQELTGVAWA